LTAIIVLACGCVAVGVDVWVFRTGHSSSSALFLLFGPAMLLLGGMGAIHPPLLYVLGPRRPLLEPRERAIGTAGVALGLVIGVAVTVAWFAGF
jgi:hypothetical protein